MLGKLSRQMWSKWGEKGSTPPKIRISSKKVSNKSCLKLNFVQRSLWEHISIFPRSGGRGLERFPSLKYNNVQEVDSVCGSMPPKIRISSKKALNKSCSKLNFIQKSSRVHMSIAPRSRARGKINISALRLFCTKFNFEQLLLKLFLMRWVFLAALSPKQNLLFHFEYWYVFVRRPTRTRDCGVAFVPSWLDTLVSV